MANYFVSYDLNGSKPTHAQMDKHMNKAGWTRGRVLETAWYVGTPSLAEKVHEHVSSILSPNDLLLVIRADEAVWNKLLITDASFNQSWGENA